MDGFHVSVRPHVRARHGRQGIVAEESPRSTRVLFVFQVGLTFHFPRTRLHPKPLHASADRPGPSPSAALSVLLRRDNVGPVRTQ